MVVDIILHAGLLNEMDLKGKAAVVIDAFRATSVIVEGLSNGASSFVPVKTIDEALQIKALDSEVLLGGERDGVKIDGFDLDNSPLSFKHDFVAGKNVVLTTTNGTRALKGAIGASAIYVGSFLNLSAVAQKVAGVSELVLVCSGSEDSVSLEDSLCAGGILYELELLADITLSDEAYMLKELYISVKERLNDFLSKGSHYRYLRSKGFGDDLDFCLQVNKRGVVPCFDGTTIRL